MSKKISTPTKNNSDYNYKVAEWRGYVVRALEDLDNEVKELKSAVNTLDDKTDKNVAGIYKKLDGVSETISNMRMKIGGMSATIAIIVSMVISYLSGVI